MSSDAITLTPLDCQSLDELLVAAVTTHPDDVMPPDESSDPGWSQRRRDAFRRFLHHRSLGPDAVETTYVIRLDGEAIGAARLMPVGDGLETGMWLAPPYRGDGIGKVVLARLIALAEEQGAMHVVASTTKENHAAQAVLRRLGASVEDAGPDVSARIDLTATRGRTRQGFGRI